MLIKCSSLEEDVMVNTFKCSSKIHHDRLRHETFVWCNYRVICNFHRCCRWCISIWFLKDLRERRRLYESLQLANTWIKGRCFKARCNLNNWGVEPVNKLLRLIISSKEKPTEATTSCLGSGWWFSWGKKPVLHVVGWGWEAVNCVCNSYNFIIKEVHEVICTESCMDTWISRAVTVSSCWK